MKDQATDPWDPSYQGAGDRERLTIPSFRHTCSQCVFLGAVEFDDRFYDLYFCEQGHFFPTIIARGSSDPHDYTSGIALAEVDPVLHEAYERAKERGFITDG
jgi:hypothetical protein